MQTSSVVSRVYQFNLRASKLKYLSERGLQPKTILKFKGGPSNVRDKSREELSELGHLEINHLSERGLQQLI